MRVWKSRLEVVNGRHVRRRHHSCASPLSPPQYLQLAALVIQWKIKPKKEDEARLDAHNDMQLRIVSKLSEALHIEAHCIRTTGDKDEKKPGKKLETGIGQRIVWDETVQGGAAHNDIQGRRN
jgi:hypothetical protein